MINYIPVAEAMKGLLSYTAQDDCKLMAIIKIKTTLGCMALVRLGYKNYQQPNHLSHFLRFTQFADLYQSHGQCEVLIRMCGSPHQWPKKDLVKKSFCRFPVLHLRFFKSSLRLNMTDQIRQCDALMVGN